MEMRLFRVSLRVNVLSYCVLPSPCGCLVGGLLQRALNRSQWAKKQTTNKLAVLKARVKMGKNQNKKAARDKSS
jgi:hypothetical protein